MGIVKDVKYVWDSDLEKLIAATYGKPYLLGRRREMGQNTIARFDVPEEPDDWAEEGALTFDEWVALPPVDPTDYEAERKYEALKLPDFQYVLNDLHDRGLLEAGDYVIEVWW